METINALEFELDAVRNRYNSCFESLQKFVAEQESYYKGLSEVVGRLLTSRVLCDAIGGYGNPNGYINIFQDNTDSPLNRMEFIRFFVGHELLDDGDPGIGWHKYDSKTGWFIDCLETDRRAEPFFHRCKEILPEGSKYLTLEGVLWVLDWHEKHEDEYYELANKLQNTKEERPPINPMLIALAKELGCRI